MFIKNIVHVFLSLTIIFVYSKSTDSDEMRHDGAFHLGFHCLPKYPFRGIWSIKGLNLCFQIW